MAFIVPQNSHNKPRALVFVQKAYFILFYYFFLGGGGGWGKWGVGWGDLILEGAIIGVAYPMRSDSGGGEGERVKNPGRLVLSVHFPAFFFACCSPRRCPILRTFPHYLNAWDRLSLQGILRFKMCRFKKELKTQR